MEHRTIKAGTNRIVSYQDDNNYRDIAEIFIRNLNLETLNHYMIEQSVETTIAAAADIDDTQVTVTSATGLIVGEAIDIYSGARVYQGIITAISGNDISVNAPLDIAPVIGDTVYSGAWDMAVDGSVAPVTFRIKPPAGVKWFLSQITINITDSTAMDDGTFGGRAALSNGLLLRVKNGIYKNYAIAYNNSGMQEQGFDVQYANKAPSGEYGVTFRRNSTLGHAVVLDGDEGSEAQIIVRDDLTGLNKMAAALEGYID